MVLGLPATTMVNVRVRRMSMFVSCDECKYDSGDFDSNEEIAAKVNADGGKMERVALPAMP